MTRRMHNLKTDSLLTRVRVAVEMADAAPWSTVYADGVNEAVAELDAHIAA